MVFPLTHLAISQVISPHYDVVGNVRKFDSLKRVTITSARGKVLELKLLVPSALRLSSLAARERSFCHTFVGSLVTASVIPGSTPRRYILYVEQGHAIGSTTPATQTVMVDFMQVVLHRLPRKPAKPD